MNNKNSFVSNNKNHQQKAILFLEKMASLYSNQDKKITFHYCNGKYCFEYKGHRLFYKNTISNQMFFGVIIHDREFFIEIPKTHKDLFHEVVYPEKVLDDIINNTKSDSFFKKLLRKISKFLNN